MNDSEYKGKLFLIVGPSGSGKGTVIDKLKDKYPGFVYPVSYTTRAPRDGEDDGLVYNFISKKNFEQMIKDGDLLEYAVVHSDNYYGTSKKEIVDALRGGAVVIREVDIQGFHSIQKLLPKSSLVSIFMEVSDLEELKVRILKRADMSEGELKKRLVSALEEIAQKGDCDYQVENKWGELMAAVSSVEQIILDEIKDLY